MALPDTEYEAILSDPSKRIVSTISWSDDEDHSPCGDFERIRTSYLYPDGDNINLYCKVEAEVITVSDLAEISRWLRMSEGRDLVADVGTEDELLEKE